MDTTRKSFSALQHLLKLSYSDKPEDQQKAAMELATFVDGAPFPAVSFSPLTHALCKLLESDNRTIVSYSAKAMKNLLLDDLLRPQSFNVVPEVIWKVTIRWEAETLCLRDLLACLQSLSLDNVCVKKILEFPNVIPTLVEFVQASDSEVSCTALASLANVFAHSTTAVLLSAEKGLIAELEASMSKLVEALRETKRSRQFLVYAMAAVANAAAHPLLKGALLAADGLAVVRAMDKRLSSQILLFGSKLGDSIQTALFRLSDKKEGDPAHGDTKYSFKWGTQPVMELSLVDIHTVIQDPSTSRFLTGCLGLWVLFVLYLIVPLFVRM